ncbi:hypothetical protein LPB41_02825 [Thalassospira sp. MA62]|nr:hypothetical protein [Thalassospira sp. MA62]
MIAAAAFITAAPLPASAQKSAPSPTVTALEDRLRTYGEIALHVFDGRDDFLAQIDDLMGLENIADADQTFAKLPRSPFAVTGRRNGNSIGTCHIFIPANLTPESGNQIFATLMRGWFGRDLTYGSDAEMTFDWLIHHEARHCAPDHFGGDMIADHQDEIAADLFAFEAVTSHLPAGIRTGLAGDIVDFRIITASLMAGPSHMNGLSVRSALTGHHPASLTSPVHEIDAFTTVRKHVSNRANEIAIGSNPTNQELIRAIIELRHAAEQDNKDTNDPLINDILIALDDAISRLAPDLHARSQTVN